MYVKFWIAFKAFHISMWYISSRIINIHKKMFFYNLFFWQLNETFRKTLISLLYLYQVFACDRSITCTRKDRSPLPQRRLMQTFTFSTFKTGLKWVCFPPDDQLLRLVSVRIRYYWMCQILPMTSTLSKRAPDCTSWTNQVWLDVAFHKKD